MTITVRVNVTYGNVSGANTNVSGVANTGHVWLDFRDSNGDTIDSSGFNPMPAPLLTLGGAPGQVTWDSDPNQPPDWTSGPIPVTQQQYDNFQEFKFRTEAFQPIYSPLGGNGNDSFNCSTWARAAFGEMGLPIPGSVVGFLPNSLPGSFAPPAPPLTDLGAGFDPLGNPTGVDTEVNRDYTAARGWTLPRDPLVLDLDGDGIETVGIDPLAPILFDHDADGVKTGTGWIQSDDGLLVLDRNGNGTIDGGAELFGDNTRTGVNQSGLTYAANGYIALQGQDSNADDQINSQDTSYTQLRVWRDLNQDGISQAGELQTLGQAGIASIGVAGTATNVNLAAMKNGCAVGNTQIASGSFTRTNGTTGQSGTAELTGSYLLAGNNFYRAFNDNPVLPTAAQNLPQMPGSGWVRDMREAASLGTHICTPRCTSTAENRYALRSCRRNILLRYSRKRPVETLVPLGNQKYICAIAKTA